MSSDPGHEPKIIVDEDWKQRVEKEREVGSQTASAPGTGDPHRGFPTPSFELLVSTFSSQALLGLGFLVDPQSGQGHYDPLLAKHAIDMLALLQEKTRGNLSPNEAEVLEETIHQLRLAFVAQAQQVGTVPIEPKSSLELP